MNLHVCMESSSAGDRYLEALHSKPSEGKRHQDSSRHTRNSTGQKLATGLGAAINRYRLILLRVCETRHCYCTVTVV